MLVSAHLGEERLGRMWDVLSRRPAHNRHSKPAHKTAEAFEKSPAGLTRVAIMLHKEGYEVGYAVRRPPVHFDAEWEGIAV